METVAVVQFETKVRLVLNTLIAPSSFDVGFNLASSSDGLVLPESP
jgi:hypothetical protein